MKCYELRVKIISSLATFGVLISLSLNDYSLNDSKEFNKLQTLYLQVVADVRNVERKIKSKQIKIFKNYSERNKESKKRHGAKIVSFSFSMLFNCLYYKNNGE